MSRLTIVGVSTYDATSASDPDPYSVPLPTGTQVGDLILVGIYPANGGIVDTRLAGLPASGYQAAGWGRATDLSDVDLQSSDYYPQFACVVTVRVKDDPVFVGSGDDGDYASLVMTEEPDYLAAIVIASQSNVGDPKEIIPSSPWADIGGTSGAAEYAHRAAYYDDVAPVPQLDMTPSGGSYRSWAYWYWGEAPPSATYLRQRQSPVRTPSRVRGVDLRQRQTPRIT